MTEVQLQEALEGQENGPVSLRERNKEKKRVAMLEATRELLRRVGYDKTSMEAIAERAEVGVATVYKYFGTKEDLVMEVVRGDMVEMLDEVSKIAADPPADLVDAVIAMITPASNLQIARERASLVRQIIRWMWLKREDVAREFMQWASAELQEKINAVLVDFQSRGVLESSLDTQAIARMIFALFDYNYICFSRGEFETVEEMNELTNKQVRLLLGN